MWIIKDESDYKELNKSGRSITYVSATCSLCNNEYSRVNKDNIKSGKTKCCRSCSAKNRVKHSPVGNQYGRYIAVKEISRNSLNKRMFEVFCTVCSQIIECELQSLLTDEYHRCLCYGESKRMAETKSLLEDSIDAYYWVGFLMADGHIGANNRIRLTLSDKDEQHLIKFNSFVNGSIPISRTRETFVTVSMMDNDYLPKLREKFNIDSRKTYNPCNIKGIDNDSLFLALVVGFIDGDGCIKKLHRRKDSSICIKIHANWIDNLNYMSSRIYNIFNLGESQKATITNSGYAYINFSNHKVVHALKRFVDSELSDVVLRRKWDLIDLSAGLRYDISSERKNRTKEMLSQGLSVSQIANVLGVSVSRISNIKKEFLVKGEVF